MKFTSTVVYVATEDGIAPVNAAVALQRPLLLNDEPNTRKTERPRQVAGALSLLLIEWRLKSTITTHERLYDSDAVSRLRDRRLGDARVNDIRDHTSRNMLWKLRATKAPVVLVVDRIDKADIQFPIILRPQRDRREFHPTRPARRYALHRAVVIIASRTISEVLGHRASGWPRARSTKIGAATANAYSSLLAQSERRNRMCYCSKDWRFRAAVGVRPAIFSPSAEQANHL